MNNTEREEFEKLEEFLSETFDGGYDEMSYSLRQKYGDSGDCPTERILHWIQQNYISKSKLEEMIEEVLRICTNNPLEMEKKHRRACPEIYTATRMANESVKEAMLRVSSLLSKDTEKVSTWTIKNPHFKDTKEQTNNPTKQ